MAHQRFDTFARVLMADASRRGVIVRVAGSLAAASPVAFGDEFAAGKKKRRRKKTCKCPICQRCLGRRCVPAADDTPCRDCGRCFNGVCAIPLLPPEPPCGLCATCESGGICVPKADNAPCGQEDGKCLNGQCNPLPVCDPAGTLPCFGGSAADCCSGQCCSEPGLTFCCQSRFNDACFGDGDCDVGLTSVGYRCR